MRAMLSDGTGREEGLFWFAPERLSTAAVVEAQRVLAVTEPEAVAKGRAGDVGVYLGDCLDALASAIADALPLFDELAADAYAVAPLTMDATALYWRNRATDTALGGR